MKIIIPFFMILSIAAAISRSACRSQPSLICNLQPASGSNVTGAVYFLPLFRKVDDRTYCHVRIRAIVSGLNNTAHGIHIHSYGDISSSNGLSTGGHFTNPEGTPVDHGHPDDEIRHWGDFGNLRPDTKTGIARYSRIDKVISLKGIVGRGITIHLMRDRGSDFQPTGASGPRIGVCVIGFANPSSTETLFKV